MQLQFAAQVRFVGTEVEMAVATEVNQDDLFLAFLAAPLGFFEGRGQGVAGLRCRQDAFNPGKRGARLKQASWSWARASMSWSFRLATTPAP